MNFELLVKKQRKLIILILSTIILLVITLKFLTLNFIIKDINKNLHVSHITNNILISQNIIVAKNLDNLNQHCSYIPLPDTRIIALRRFLQKYKSPMLPYADLIISQADKYNQDWRIVVAISGVESRFGKILPHNSYNAWGWRGGRQGKFSNFNNWEHAIIYITKAFSSGYGQAPNPYSFYKIYCPPCTTAWPNTVTKYMQELSNIRKNINKQYKLK